MGNVGNYDRRGILGERVDLLLLGEKRGDILSKSIVDINEEDGWLSAS